MSHIDDTFSSASPATPLVLNAELKSMYIRKMPSAKNFIAEHILHCEELRSSPFCPLKTLLAGAEDVVMFSIISHAGGQQACLQVSERVSQSNRSVVLNIQPDFLLGQEHFLTLVAAGRCADARIAEPKEVVVGSEEFSDRFIRFSSGVLISLASPLGAVFWDELLLVFKELYYASPWQYAFWDLSWVDRVLTAHMSTFCAPQLASIAHVYCRALA